MCFPEKKDDKKSRGERRERQEEQRGDTEGKDANELRALPRNLEREELRSRVERLDENAAQPCKRSGESARGASLGPPSPGCHFCRSSGG